MPGTTPDGVPYAQPSDPLVQWPATSQALAEAVLAKAGGTMTGPLKIDAGASGAGVIRPGGALGNVGIYDAAGTALAPLNVGTPTAVAHAATKAYVDGMGTWKDYTPNVTGCTTSAVIARYVQSAKTVHVRGRLTIATVTGDVQVSLPVAPGTAGDSNNAWGVAVDISPSARIALAPFVSSSALLIRRVDPTLGSIQPMSPTLPFVWAAGDMIMFALTYESV